VPPERDQENPAVVPERDQARATASVGDPGLRVKLESNLPSSIPVGSANAIFCFGHCFHRRQRVTELRLLVGGAAHQPTASRMPRRDLFAWLHGIGEDPEGRSYRSGFWATLPVPAFTEPGILRLSAAIRLESGAEHLVLLGSTPIVDLERRPWSGPRLPDGTIAVCMATFEPNITLFRDQIESLRRQTDERWICLISDDRTAEQRFQEMLEVLHGDPRFVVSRSPERRGPYRNFERALMMAPADAALVAPCDQDDRWYPNKLEALRAALGSARLVYSDQRLVSRDGLVLRDSLLNGRRNDCRNLASLLIANAIPGAAMLFRRELMQLALPFPDAPGVPYHDHWLALVALASGEIAYADEPLYDYVQHSATVSGDLIESARPAAAGRVFGRRSRGWRAAYFGGFVSREVMARTLLLRCAPLPDRRKRRVLARFIASARSPASFIWLAARPLRRLVGRDETLGGEIALIHGVLWRWSIVLVSARAELPGRHPYDASYPDPPRFEQPRLRRWRAGS
jgi:glycosyltransferase involved in cell wall biosynthesis